jgi:hypothetical protein
MTKLAKLVLVLIILSIWALHGFAQQGQQKSAPDKPDSMSPRPAADETFDLDIDVQQFTRENFQASTAVSVQGKREVNVRVGVGIATGRIDLLLRNVQGHVRFRGSLARILELIEERHSGAPMLK